jgi:tetratricopeptide (TPR) repeat protein
MDSIASDIAAARTAFERGEYGTALELTRRVLSQRPGYADVRNLAGITLAMLGDHVAALEELDAAVAINPAYVEALLNRSLVLSDLGRYDEAAVSLQAAGDSDGSGSGRGAEAGSGTAGMPSIAAGRIANAHMAVGDLYAGLGAWDRAEREYRTALELRPAFTDIRHKAARCRMEQGDLDAAIEQLEAVKSSAPGYVPAGLDLGLAYFRRGDKDRARTVWQEYAQRGESPQLRAYLTLV